MSLSGDNNVIRSHTDSGGKTGAAVADMGGIVAGVMAEIKIGIFRGKGVRGVATAREHHRESRFVGKAVEPRGAHAAVRRINMWRIFQH